MDSLIEYYTSALEIKNRFMITNSSGEKELTRPYAAIFAAIELEKSNKKITPNSINELSKKLFNVKLNGRKGSDDENGMVLEKRIDKWFAEKNYSDLRHRVLK